MNADTPLTNDEIVLISLIRMARRKKAAWYLLPKARRYRLGIQLREINQHISMMTKAIVDTDKPEQWDAERKETERMARQLLSEDNNDFYEE